MLKIGIYCRKSTDDNKRQKASIEDQKMWAHEYLKTLKVPYEIVVEYEEKKSAKAPWRPIFNEMMGQIYAGKINTVVVWAVDRLSRNEIDEWAIKWAVREWKLKEIHTKDSVYTETELFTMGIFLSMSAEEIATMKRRIIRRMDAMVTREGKVPFHAPYGYKNIGGGLVEVVENEAEVVKKIFKLRADGASYQMIADILNNEGISTRRKNGENSSGKWTKSITEYVIKNEFYLGVVKFMGKVGQGFFDTFISRDIFEKANHGSSQKVARKPLEFPLKWLLLLEDGRSLTATRKKWKYVYYHTQDWSFRVTQKEIFDKLEKVIENWKTPDEIMSKIREICEKEIFSGKISAEDEKKKAEKELQDLKMQEKNLNTMYIKGKVSEEMFDEILKEIFVKRDKTEEKIKKLSAMEIADNFALEKIIELASNLLVAYKNGDDVQKGAIIRAGFIELVIDEKKLLKIKEKEPFYWLSLLNVQDGRGSWDWTSDQSVMSRLL